MATDDTLYITEDELHAQKAPEVEKRGNGPKARTVTIVALCFCYAITVAAIAGVIVVWSQDSVIRTCVQNGGSWTSQNECAQSAPAPSDGATVQ